MVSVRYHALLLTCVDLLVINFGSVIHGTHACTQSPMIAIYINVWCTYIHACLHTVAIYKRNIFDKMSYFNF